MGCWRNSLRGCDHRLAQKLYLGNWRLLTSPSPPILGMYILLTIPTLGAISRMQPWETNVLLRPSELCTWLNHLKASIQPLKVLEGRCRDLFILWLPKTTLYSNSLAYLNVHLRIWRGLPLSSVFPWPLCIWATFKFHLGNSQSSEPKWGIKEEDWDVDAIPALCCLTPDSSSEKEIHLVLFKLSLFLNHYSWKIS